MCGNNIKIVVIALKLTGVSESEGVPRSTISHRPEVVDDFIRNFLIRYKMSRTLDAFQREWYELQQKGELTKANPELVPDCYVQNEELENKVFN